MKKNICILLLFTCFIYKEALSQTAHFELVPSSVSTQIKAKANDSLSLFYKCVYIGDKANPTFNGVVYTNYITNKNNSPAIAHDSFSTAAQVPPDTIHDLDTFRIYCHILVNPGYFNNGKENLVIIWPTGGRQSNKSTVMCADTFQYATTVTITGLAGLDEKDDLFGSLSIYPNPANTVLNIQNNNPALVLKQVRIIDYTGREVLRRQDNLSELDVSALKPGTYFLELSTKDDDNAVYTILISR